MSISGFSEKVTCSVLIPFPETLLDLIVPAARELQTKQLLVSHTEVLLLSGPDPRGAFLWTSKMTMYQILAVLGKQKNRVYKKIAMSSPV